MSFLFIFVRRLFHVNVYKFHPFMFILIPKCHFIFFFYDNSNLTSIYKFHALHYVYFNVNCLFYNNIIIHKCFHILSMLQIKFTFTLLFLFIYFKIKMHWNYKVQGDYTMIIILSWKIIGWENSAYFIFKCV